MKRNLSILSVLSLAFVVAFVTLAGTASAQQPAAERLTKQQLIASIATAKTLADHERIAQDYRAQAQDSLAQAKEHEAMVAAYKSNSNINDKNQAATIGHCEYFATKFNDLAMNSEQLAKLHDQMAQEAETK